MRTPEEMALYLNACIAESDGDAGFITDAIGGIARAKGMTDVAQATGLSRQNLYRALSADGNPTFATVYKVINALGISLSAKPAE